MQVHISGDHRLWQVCLAHVSKSTWGFVQSNSESKQAACVRARHEAASTSHTPFCPKVIHGTHGHSVYPSENPQRSCPYLPSQEHRNIK